MKKGFSWLVLAASLWMVSPSAQAQTETSEQQNLYITNKESKFPYRIPAIATAPNGDIFAISDFRPCGNDIGYGEVDVMCRISKNNGKTWSEEFFVANGVGDNHGGDVWKIGFGDAAIVADAERNELLVMLVCGKTVCWHGNYIPNSDKSNPNRVARVRAKLNDKTGEWEWSEPVEATEQIYSQFVDEQGNPTVQSLFIGSGRICQSRLIKVGEYYRIYCSVWTKNGGNRVLYSDDFGENWFVLGTINDRPAPAGDEPKCEELPDGSVVLSSRCHGRYFNIFTYTDVEKAKGSWGAVAHSGPNNNGVSVVGNSTNGEIMIVPVVNKATKAKTYLALQSVPFGPNGRRNVGICYKELTDFATDYASPAELAKDWDGSFQVSTLGSAYSTMTLQKDNTIGFLYEESTFERDYTIVYKNFSIEDITNGKYTYCTDKKMHKKYVASQVAPYLAKARLPKDGNANKVGVINASQIDQLDKMLKKIAKKGTPQSVAELNAVLLSATVQAQSGQEYLLRNMGFTEGKPAYNDNLYMTATEKGLTASALATGNAAQAWTLQQNAKGEWVLYNAATKTYVGKLGGTSSIVPLVNNIAEAGTFKLQSDLGGQTAIVATQPENPSYPCLHLSSQHNIVVWNASGASLWEIIKK